MYSRFKLGVLFETPFIKSDDNILYQIAIAI
jgi:hypothetical protein